MGAIGQAMAFAGRFQQSFLRLSNDIRDMRRLAGTVVLNGRQLKSAERQVVAIAEGANWSRSVWKDVLWSTHHLLTKSRPTPG